MYAITNKSGNKTTLYEDLKPLYDEYSKLYNFYESNMPIYDEILEDIYNNGYFELELNKETYYIIKTTVDKKLDLK